MKPIDKMDDLERRLCEKCDYLNLEVPMDKKKAACWKRGMENRLECEVYLKTERLKDRVRYLKGQISGAWICGKQGCFFETYEEE